MNRTEVGGQHTRVCKGNFIQHAGGNDKIHTTRSTGIYLGTLSSVYCLTRRAQRYLFTTQPIDMRHSEPKLLEYSIQKTHCFYPSLSSQTSLPESISQLRRIPHLVIAVISVSHVVITISSQTSRTTGIALIIKNLHHLHQPEVHNHLRSRDIVLPSLRRRDLTRDCQDCPLANHLQRHILGPSCLPLSLLTGMGLLKRPSSFLKSINLEYNSFHYPLVLMVTSFSPRFHLI
jgi:hypothetical protein